jgi:Tfp pilus assembly protein PilN
MRAVNLLPSEQGQRRGPNKMVLAGATSSSAVLMLLGAVYLNAHSTVKDRQASLSELKAELAALPQRPHKASGDSFAEKLVQERIGRLGALSSALSHRVSWDRLLREVATVLPDDVWLQQLSASAPTAATAGPAVAPPVLGGATTFTIAGSTYTQEGVARLLIRLELVPDLDNITLSTSALQELAGQKRVQFTINADVKPPEVGA